MIIPAFLRLALALSLPLALGACTAEVEVEHGAHDGHDHGAAEQEGLVCPPCGMEMPADAELSQVGGLKFAFCSETCAEQVALDPQKHAKFAAP